MKLWFAIVCSLFALCLVSAQAGTLDRGESAPKGWRDHVFRANFAFPSKARLEVRPWDAINFRSAPSDYLNAVLHYAMEGQDLEHWNLRRNKIRRWVHVPWLGPGVNGREFIHGLTRGRDLKPRELGPKQLRCRQNWALAFYNDVGGSVLGKIWGRGQHQPELSALPFPPGTVAVKLVFTQATVEDDLRLQSAPEILANIHADNTASATACANATLDDGVGAPRAPQKLRLIQVDVAVREVRASYKTGWVFGSFRFDGRLPGKDPWSKLAPLGLMWGNDPLLGDAEVLRGDRPRQTIMASVGIEFGRGGRMNGVVDERQSACSSCHMAAQWPSVAPMTAPAPWADGKCWYRNVDGRYPFGFPPGQRDGCGDPAALKELTPLDFSLQLAIALRNWSLNATQHSPKIKTTLGRLNRLSSDELEVNGLHALALRR